MDFAVNGRSGRHDTSRWIDLEQTIGVVGQRVRNRIGRRIEIECIGGDSQRQSR